MVEFDIFATAYIIGGSLVAYQIGYVAEAVDRQSKDSGSNPDTVGCVSFSTEIFLIF